MKTKLNAKKPVTPVEMVFKKERLRSKNFFLTKGKNKNFLYLLILFSFLSVKINAQSGTMFGIGHDCQTYSFSICPGQSITPIDYRPFNFCRQNGNIDVSFNILGTGWRVARNTFSFVPSANGQITGLNPAAIPIAPITIPSNSTLSPISYTTIGGIEFVNFGINNISVGVLINASNYSITVLPVFFGPQTFTLCTDTASSVVITPTIPLIGGPWTYSWQPGPGTGNPITVSPTVSTIYTVTATSGTCTSSTTVAVTVTTCANGCCIGNPCNPSNPAGSNPLLTNWQVPLNNLNYIFQTNTTRPNGRVGIGNITPCTPGNLLEVFKGFGTTGVSGLRLTDLASIAPLTPTNNNVLSIDNLTGDVILTTIPSPTMGAGPGNYCVPGPANNLTSDYQMPLNSFVYRFTGTGAVGGGNSQDIVSVGYPCGIAPPARFSVWDNQASGVGYETHAGYFKNSNQPTAGTNYFTSGVYGEAKGIQLGGPSTNPPINIGGLFEGWGTQRSIGACGRTNKSSIPGPIFNAATPPWYAIGGAFASDSATMPAMSTPVLHIGTYGRGSNSNYENYGVYGEVPLDATGIASRAVYGTAPNVTNHWAAYFDGAGYITGGVWMGSDSRLKKNIIKVENIMDKIEKIDAYTYFYKTDEFKQKNFDDKKHYGFIAQQLKEVFPEMVKEDGKGFYAVEYDAMIPVLLAAIKEQQSQIDELKNMVQSLASNTAENKLKNAQAVNLSDKNAIVLDQNIPNPFAESTLVNYNIPTDFNKAQIIFSTNDGRIIKVVDITAKGEGHLTVFANDLSNGMYTYSLIVDGKTIDTKKMVKQ